MSIILLRGFSNSGKDFIGEILCNQYNYTRYAFADSLKNIVAKQLNCSIDILHSQDGKSQVCHTDPLRRTYRQILIDEALRLRNIDSDFFAKQCCKDIKHDKVVITDCRFVNEVNSIKSVGGITMRVNRGERPIWYSAAVDYNNEPEGSEQRLKAMVELGNYSVHASEYSSIGLLYDYYIDNNGSIDNLHKQVNSVVNL